MLWIKRIVFVFALAPLVMCQAADEAFKAGEHYDILPQAVRTANSEKIEINEVFSYTCGHCFNFQTDLHPWVKALPADVDFQSTPAVWQSGLEPYARAYYAAKILNVLDKVHMPIFDAIHVKKKSIKKQNDFEAIFVAVSLEDGSYEIDSSDSAQWYLKTYDNADAAVTTGFNIEAALTVTIGSETDLLAGVEELEFNDGFVSTQVSTERFDLNGDNKKDLIVSGTLSDDVLDYSESTRDIFADLGPGNDSIRTGSGDGFYRLGLGNDVVEDLSDQDFDVVELSGNSDTWSKFPL